MVSTYYNIPGELSQEDIGSRARWLVNKGIFRYGGINLTVRISIYILLIKSYVNHSLKDKIYNIQAPFASPLVIDLIRAQWFEGGRSDRPTFNDIVSQRKITAETLILCFTCVRSNL